MDQPRHLQPRFLPRLAQDRGLGGLTGVHATRDWLQQPWLRIAAKGGGHAELLDHQNAVADMITNQDMTAEEAAAKWVADNEDVWKAWMPAS